MHRPTAQEPWTIFQDLVDDLGVEDQSDVEDILAEQLAKEVRGKIHFDSEGSAFVATSTDEAAMRALAKLIAKLAAAAEA